MTWDDLKYILALMRGGSLGKAARQLNVDKTTVSRRVAALEDALGVSLVERGGHGQMRLTQAGRKVAGQAEAMEDVERRIRADLGAQPDGLAGRVRISTVPILAHHVLLTQLGALKDLAPGLKIELLAEARDTDILEGEADIAMRLARPRTGGQGVLTRKIGVLSYGCYAASMAGGDLPWIGFEPNMQHLEIAQAIETLASAPGSRRAGLSVNDAEGLLRAVQAGLGMSLLPRIIADAMPGLRCLDVDATRIPKREIWVLTRRDHAGLDRIKVVHSWLHGIFNAV
ncbi:MAG: LysR family transcriptional regulator [Pseudomonadota bacterium]